MIYNNSIYGIFNPNNIQEQLRQHHTDQMQKSIKCAQKLDELLKCIDEVEPEYQRVAFEQCCVVIGNHMRQHGML